MSLIQLPALTANRFQGGCSNCGYGTSIDGRCPYCLVSNMSDIEQGFQNAMNAEPYNPVHPMIYADWLDEHDRPKDAQYHRNVAEGISSSEYKEMVNQHPNAAETHNAVRHYLGRNGGDINLNWILGRLVEDNPNNVTHRRVYAGYLESKHQTIAAQQHRQILRALRGGSRFVTKDIATRLTNNPPWGGIGTTLYHITARNADGTAVMVRVNGALKTWKTRPDDFRLPTKYGLRDGVQITPRNQHEWMTHDITEY